MRGMRVMTHLFYPTSSLRWKTVGILIWKRDRIPLVEIARRKHFCEFLLYFFICSIFILQL